MLPKVLVRGRYLRVPSACQHGLALRRVSFGSTSSSNRRLNCSPSKQINPRTSPAGAPAPQALHLLRHGEKNVVEGMEEPRRKSNLTWTLTMGKLDPCMQDKWWRSMVRRTRKNRMPRQKKPTSGISKSSVAQTDCKGGGYDSGQGQGGVAKPQQGGQQQLKATSLDGACGGTTRAARRDFLCQQRRISVQQQERGKRCVAGWKTGIYGTPS
jgi:hypothetical protein